jgi:hypothetical protein
MLKSIQVIEYAISMLKINSSNSMCHLQIKINSSNSMCHLHAKMNSINLMCHLQAKINSSNSMCHLQAKINSSNYILYLSWCSYIYYFCFLCPNKAVKIRQHNCIDYSSYFCDMFLPQCAAILRLKYKNLMNIICPVYAVDMTVDCRR